MSVGIRPVFYRTVKVDGLAMFYREAGPKDGPTIVLLHGLRSSRRDPESLHRSARALALHALHAGLHVALNIEKVR